MLEPRQKAVTREQVRHKVLDAKHRAFEAVKAATTATTEAEYEAAVREGVKAATDYETWSMVLLVVE